MATTNPDWYAAQYTRKYPVDEFATTVGDAGERLPHDILIDCHLRWPIAAGQYAFLSALTVSKNIVTAVFMAADVVDDNAVFLPLAAVTLPRPVHPHVHYPVRALYTGTAGFVVFGDVAEPFSARFSSPRQTLLVPKCARPYAPLPIPSLGKHGHAVGLTDIVRIAAGTDITITSEELEIGGAPRQALVFRLSDSTTSRNLLKNYVGPCGRRPESRNCDRDGIESINGVRPDCNGNINISFVGMLAGPFSDCAGVTLDQSMGIADVCNRRLSRVIRGVDGCASDSSLSVYDPGDPDEPTDPGDSVASESTASTSTDACSELPFLELFDDPDSLNWTVQIGDFTIVEGLDSPEEPSLGSAGDPLSTYAAFNPSRRNVATFDGCGLPTVDIVARAHVRLKNNASSYANGGIVLNYRIAEPLLNPHPVYFLVTIDKIVGKLRILRFNGGTLVEEAAATLAINAFYDDWYEITAAAVTADDQVTISAAVRSITDPDWPEASCSVTTNRYLPADGVLGVGTDRAYTYFAFFEVEAAD